MALENKNYCYCFIIFSSGGSSSFLYFLIYKVVTAWPFLFQLWLQLWGNTTKLLNNSGQDYAAELDSFLLNHSSTTRKEDISGNIKGGL